MIKKIFTLLILLTVGGAAFSASAERRVALVIGNDTYKALPNLRNARTDARGMAKKLRGLGFEVILQLNVSRRGMYRAISKFERKLSDGATGLAFFAGHGIQADGKNYLIPADARVEVEDDLAAEAVTAQQILAAMTRAGNPLNILILDACRDNPLPRRRRSTARGLTVVGIPQGAKGTAILYAAGPGQAAIDGPRGGHGLFTGELLKVLGQPGLKLEDVFKRVNARVYRRSKGRQTPWSLATLRGDFYFKQARNAAGVGQSAAGSEALLWDSVRDSRDRDMIQSYLEQYPQGAFATIARLQLKKLRRTNTANPAMPGNTFRDCNICPEMVVIPAGDFLMGSAVDEPDAYADEGPKHQVSINYSFAVGKFEIMQEEWRALMGTNPSRFKGGRNPVEGITWAAAQAYIKKLSQKTGKPYRLLSEAEWEYVARAGSTTRYAFGDKLSAADARFSVASSTAAGSYRRNGFGVYDMHGNVWEWVADCWANNYAGAPGDGSARKSDPDCRHVLRGGAWSSLVRLLRSASRYKADTSENFSSNGFRVALSLE